MARPIVLSNGEMHVGINTYGQVHDFYFPYVGHENHTIGRETRHKIGVWVDGQLSWTDTEDWTSSFRYPEPALVGHTILKNERLGIALEFDDTVDSAQNVLLRNIHIVNHHEQQRDLRLFMHQAFVIGDSRSNTDTAQYLPDSQAIVHYRGRRVFVVSGSAEGGCFDQHSIGIFGIEGREGTWRDAEDGELSCNMVEHGQVDSTLRFRFTLAPHSSVRAHYWIAAGTSLRDALSVHRDMQDGGVDRHFISTAKWWHDWLKPAFSTLDSVADKQQRRMFLTSLMMLKAHMDKRGAINASLDSAMLNYGRDAYAYSWPRDGAYVLWPLIRLGYRDEALSFFDFCRRGLHPNGYLSHKYRADGALGSSWHPYQQADGSVAPPIQEDETALVLFMFAQVYHMQPSSQLLDEYYDSFILPMANFLASHIDSTTQLPLPSYDLWEEKWQTTTYTTSIVYAALLAAADLADVRNDDENAVAWRAVAEDIYHAAQGRLYDQEKGHLIKGLVKYDSDYTTDTTIDMSSVFGSFMYGLFSPKSQAVRSTIAKVETMFDQANNVGLPRYEGDDYLRRDDAPSNRWHITTLWYAQYCIETGDIARAKTILSWVADHSLKSGTLSEQVAPDGELVSVAPLVWSHAEYITTVLDLMNEKSYDG